MKKRMLAILLVLLVIAAIALNPNMVIRSYTLDAAQLNAPVRLVLLTDLHSCYYGENMAELVQAIDSQQPDLILLSGDIFDDELSDDHTITLLRQIGRRYPCYYVTGNHEAWCSPDLYYEKMTALEACGVTRLSGETVDVVVNGQTLTLCGVDDPYCYLQDEDFDFRAQIRSIQPTPAHENYTILLSHRPELIDLYAECGFDLALCGHAHGGQVRLPGIINGLFAPNQGWLPKYAGGLYQYQGMTEIVSRGLARESTRLPRVFNRPELVMIDLK